LTFDAAQLERIRGYDAEAMRVNKLSQANVGTGYQAIRNFDIMEAAANNQNSIAATNMAAGLGLGAGLNMAQMMGNMQQQILQPIQPSISTPEERLIKHKKLFDNGLIDESEYKAKRLEILSEI
jgi:membrane protease subunit (stomatin/prohibitin family)